MEFTSVELDMQKREIRVAGYGIIKSTTNWNFAKERFQ